jgi:hypothetical protein
MISLKQQISCSPEKWLDEQRQKGFSVIISDSKDTLSFLEFLKFYFVQLY